MLASEVNFMVGCAGVVVMEWKGRGGRGGESTHAVFVLSRRGALRRCALIVAPHWLRSLRIHHAALPSFVRGKRLATLPESAVVIVDAPCCSIPAAIRSLTRLGHVKVKP